MSGDRWWPMVVTEAPKATGLRRTKNNSGHFEGISHLEYYDTRLHEFAMAIEDCHRWAISLDYAQSSHL
jgi:hypothetical protein